MPEINHFEIKETLLSWPEADLLGFDAIIVLEEYNNVFTELKKL